MERSLDSDVVTVWVPPRAEFMHVLRAVTAAVASHLQMPFDSVDDLRLAVDEACARILTIRAPATALRLDLERGPGRLEAVVSLDAPLQDWPTPGLEDTVSWSILVALVDLVRPESDRRGPAIRLVKRTLDADPAP